MYVGTIGSCWALSTVQVLESQWALTGKEPHDPLPPRVSTQVCGMRLIKVLPVVGGWAGSGHKLVELSSEFLIDCDGSQDSTSSR